jgi:hypothetical protein
MPGCNCTQKSIHASELPAASPTFETEVSQLVKKTAAHLLWNPKVHYRVKK